MKEGFLNEAWRAWRVKQGKEVYVEQRGPARDLWYGKRPREDV